MGRTSRDNRGDRRPRIKPVERIELNMEHAGRKLIIAGVLLVFGGALLAYAFAELMAPETGWRPVQANSSAGPTSAGDFTFLYESHSTAEAKGVTTLYSRVCQEAFQLFHSAQAYEGVTNVYAINRHPNEVLEIDEGLYRAFSQIAGSGRRELYLGPIYERYDDLFFCQDDAQLAEFDPRLSDTVRQEYGEVLSFANDPESIRLELLGEDRVRLHVSEAYLAWAEENEVENFIDFAWMQNAFVADYLAGELTAGGYTAGVLSSYDGFTRNLDGRGVDYTFSLCHRRGNTVYPAADLYYSGPMSWVQMRDYPLGDADFLHYYELRTGEIRTSYLDTSDALCRSSIDTLTCYSREKGCAEILLEMIPVYIAGEFREASIPQLAAGGTQSVYCRDGEVLHTDPDLKLGNFFQEEGLSYTARQIAS